VRGSEAGQIVLARNQSALDGMELSRQKLMVGFLKSLLAKNFFKNRLYLQRYLASMVDDVDRWYLGLKPTSSYR